MKDPLQVLLVSLAQVSSTELNEAIFEYPELGVIEAVGRVFGEEREIALLKALSEALKMPFITDEQLFADVDLAGADPAKTEALTTAHKALPLGWQDYGGERFLKLAMANPLDQEGISAFSQLYVAEVRPCLARERAIKQAAVRKFAAEKQRSAPSGILTRPALDCDSPEVRKAVQQVAATALKHQAESVEIRLDADSTGAEFLFEEGQRSRVDIRVSPAAFAGALLRTGQIVELSAERVEAVCRINFRSSHVNCTVEIAAGENSSSSSLPPWGSMTLSEFAIDAPDDPNFWLSLPEDISLQIKQVLRDYDGLFIVAGKDDAARMEAVQALLQTYSESQFLDSFTEFNSTEEGEKCIISCPAPDVLEALEYVRSAPEPVHRAAAAVISYYQLPRICVFCSGPEDSLEESLLRLPDYISVDGRRLRRGKGCPACGGRGVLGFTGAASIVVLGTEKQKQLLGASIHDRAKKLVLSGVRTVLDAGVQKAVSGIVTLDSVIDKLPQPDPAYERARRSFEPETIEEPAKEERDNVRSRTEMRPLSGAAAFSSRAKAERPRPGRGSVLRHFEEDLPEEQAKIELLTPRRNDQPLLLIVDDDPDQRAILKRVFELEGYGVEAVADGIDGIVTANRLRPDLIIVDFMMPDIDGRETIRRLKKNAQTAEIPVIALTAYSDPDVEYGLLRAGANDFCAKSVAKKVLLKRVERLLGPR